MRGQGLGCVTLERSQVLAHAQQGLNEAITASRYVQGKNVTVREALGLYVTTHYAATDG